jgi:hypothetical protein
MAAAAATSPRCSSIIAPDQICPIGLAIALLWQRLLGRPGSEHGRLCHGAGGPEGGGRCRRAFMLTIL